MTNNDADDSEVTLSDAMDDAEVSASDPVREGNYIDTSMVPISGRDDWSVEEKISAIEDAESQLEWDVNGGDPIDPVHHLHRKAAKAYASYELAAGAYKTDDPRYGDMIDSGTRSNAWVDHFLDMYERAVSSISPTYSDPDDGGGGSGGSGDELLEDNTTGFSFESF